MWHLDVILPARTISMRKSDNPYITPTIKILLRKRNKLRRSDKVKAADHLAVRINRLISQKIRAHSSASNRDTSQLWKLLKSTGNWASKKASNPNLDPDIINDYFDEIATDPMYNKEDVILASRSRKEDSIVQSCPISYHRDVIEIMLAKVAQTSPGNDEIPYWVYRDCARGLANVVTKIINFSLSSGAVPSAWRVAAITPVTKN